MAKKVSKKSSLISKRPVSSEKKVPKTLKPLRARQVIRRFHVLLKYKNAVLKQFQTRTNWSEDKQGSIDENYISYIKKDSLLQEIYQQHWDNRWKSLIINKTPESVIDPKNNDNISKDLSLEEMVKILARIDSEISKRGGIETYQIASSLGQDRKRGGDSSKILVKWIKEIGWNNSDAKALEIGCLSSQNDISTSKLFKDITRIDLHSQEPGVIEQQDFLERPLPKDDFERYNLISCSLVINFVPTPEKRGEMLCRICKFLQEPTSNRKSLLFLVLPSPCVENSRYCDLTIMNHISSKLGFEEMKFYQTPKLSYWLYEWNGSKNVDNHFALRKKEVRSGSNRNNFSIVIK